MISFPNHYSNDLFIVMAFRECNGAECWGHFNEASITEWPVLWIHDEQSKLLSKQITTNKASNIHMLVCLGHPYDTFDAALSS